MIYDVAIIGGGPAGMTAGLYAKRAGLTAVIFEEKAFGGQIVNSHQVDNYPGLPHISGYDLADKLYNQMAEFEIEVVRRRVISVSLSGAEKKIATKKGEYLAKNVIIATGAAPRKLGIDREDEFIGAGVSYCATCDGAFYKDKVTMVIGGGNTALDDALYLSKFSKKVYLVHRRDKFRGSPSTLEKIKNNDKIEIITSNEVASLEGEQFLSGVKLKDGKTILVDGLFVAIGNEPRTELFKDELSLTPDGYITANEEMKTNLEGVYAAGDVINKKLRQVVTAQNDGAIAVSFITEAL